MILPENKACESRQVQPLDHTVVKDPWIALISARTRSKPPALDQSTFQAVSLALADQPWQWLERQDSLVHQVAGFVDPKGGTNALEQLTSRGIVVVQISKALSTK